MTTCRSAQVDKTWLGNGRSPERVWSWGLKRPMGICECIVEIPDHERDPGESFSYIICFTELTCMRCWWNRRAANHIVASTKVNHHCQEICHQTAFITFSNGVKAKNNLVDSADEMGSRVGTTLGVIPDRLRSTSTCYHCIIDTADVRKLGLHDLSLRSTIELWGGEGIEKIVFSPLSAKYFPSTVPNK